MKILVVGKFYPDSFALHIANTLLNLGHCVSRYEPGVAYKHNVIKPLKMFVKVSDYLKAAYQQTKPAQLKELEQLKRLFNKEEPDLVFCAYDYLTPIQISELKRLSKAKFLLWFPDAISNFGKAMFLDAEYDVLFFKEPFIVPILKDELGLNAYYMPECCNPQIHRRYELTIDDKLRFSCDLSTAGNMHTARSNIFKKIKKERNVKIWGNPASHWMDLKNLGSSVQNVYLVNEEKCKAYQCSKIVLNPLYPTEVFGMNARLFEVAGTGSFQITSQRKSLDELFEIGREIVSFSTLSELEDKIEYYLTNDHEREQIALASYTRAHKDHTYENRVIQILDKLKNSV
jgi:spore maturation protein CgeB